jgi:N-acetylglucosaminyl-diphospho-decaprenol L-rhamnosyltransferase
VKSEILPAPAFTRIDILDPAHNSNMYRLTISIVSHGQAAMIKKLLDDFKKLSIQPSAVIITINIPEHSVIDPDAYPFLVKIISNKVAQGFGANHNSAFAASTSDFFCVLNPDVRFNMNPFPVLLESLSSAGVGIVAPMVSNASGMVEDSARYFVTPGQLIKRVFRKKAGIIPELLRQDKPELVYPDWLAGICMIFRADTFRAIRGFDEGYRLYYEDVDICARMRFEGYSIALCPQSGIIHRTRRHLVRNPRYLAWHIASAARYFRSDVYKALRNRNRFQAAHPHEASGY